MASNIPQQKSGPQPQMTHSGPRPAAPATKDSPVQTAAAATDSPAVSADESTKTSKKMDDAETAATLREILAAEREIAKIQFGRNKAIARMIDSQGEIPLLAGSKQYTFRKRVVRGTADSDTPVVAYHVEISAIKKLAGDFD